MRAPFLISLGIAFGVVGIFLFQQFFNIRTIAQNVEEYIPNTLRQKIVPSETFKNFLEEKITGLQNSGQMFILADLTSMQLDVYKDNVSLLSVPIKAKGREGSWWETPAGLYSVKTKEKNHFSSIGEVYMPWSMQFQGNFFVHGIPYYPGGKEVSTNYSGGCIRLENDDAKKVFDLIERGAPLVVYENATSTLNSEKSYTFGPSTLTAENFLVADLTDGFTFASHGPDTDIPASVASNLLVAIVAAEYMDIERKITIDPSDLVTTVRPRLAAGKKYAVHDYLYLLLQESSQEASHVLARALGTSRTVDVITAKAEAIGMEKTKFTQASMFQSENRTTPSDLYQLLRYMYFNRKFLLTISADTAETRIYGAPAFSDIENLSLFKGDPQFVGGVVGDSVNGHTGLFVFEIPFGETVRPVGIILDGSKNVEADVQAIRSFVATSFRK